MKSLESQSIIDLSIQSSGSALAAYLFAKANSMSITDSPMPGLELQAVAVENAPIAAYYAAKNIKPATDAGDGVDEVERVFFEELPIEFS